MFPAWVSVYPYVKKNIITRQGLYTLDGQLEVKESVVEKKIKLKFREKVFK